MKDVVVRWAQALGTSALLATIVATGTGCGAISAAANPKVAWAIKDPAPMSVVVRRADVAEKTATEVDRVMTDTPANDDSAWLANVGPKQEDSTAMLGDIRKHEIYAVGGPGGQARIVPAEVWAKSLAKIEPKPKAKGATPAPAAAPAASTAVASAAPAAPAAPSAPATDTTSDVADAPAPVAKSANKPGKLGKKKPGSLAKNDKGEKSDKKSRKKALADTATASTAPATSTTETTSAALSTAAPAAAPAPAAASVSASSAKYPSLLAAIDKDLGASWGEVMEKKKAIGELKTQIAALETKNDDKATSDADKKANKKSIEDLEKQVDAGEKEANKLAEAFVPKAKTAAGKAAPEVREKFGTVLVNLRQAVDDAKIANGAAAVRYPLAASSMVDSTKAMAAVYTADIIEEKTGKRPVMAGFQPGVTMEGGSVAITLNGLSQSDLGKLSIKDVTSEVASRTTKWVGHAMGLLGSISSTKDQLTFEDDVLAALIDGFKAGGWNPPQAATIPDAPAGGAAGGAQAQSSSSPVPSAPKGLPKI